jgi:hypothetical protein
VATVPETPAPPHTIIWDPDQIALWAARASGTFAPMEVGVHVLLAGLYRAPSLKIVVDWSCPPQMIISVPVQTDELSWRGEGTFAPVEVAVQPLDAGL